jgi:hypothetical protein
MAHKEPQFERIKGARTATKKQERELVERARKLKKDPRLVVPDLNSCPKRCFLCPFARSLARMERIQAVADDEGKLQRLASSGDELSRAYAATLLLALSGKAPFFGRAMTPFGEALFALRGKCRREKLILVQHFDDPALRMIGVLDMVRDRRYHIYSMDDKYFCSGKSPRPPEEFIGYMAKHLSERVRVEDDDGTFRCQHLTHKDLKDPSRPYLNIRWVSADRDIALCQRCTRSSGNTFARFLERMAIPDPRDDFALSIVGALKCVKECDSCDIDAEAIDPELLEQYFTGKIGDQVLLEKQLTSIHEALRARGQRLYVIGNRCFGTDEKAFLKALAPGADEEVPVKVLLKKIEGPVIIDGETAPKFIEQEWKEHGKAILRKLLGDKELAKEMFESVDNERITAMQVVKDAIVHIKQRDIIAMLPEYDKLPAIARYADDVARIYMSAGADEAARYIERNIPDDGRVRPAALALLKAMDRDTSKVWAFAENERDFSDFLKDTAKAFLDSDPDTYHDALQALLSKTGSTEIIAHKEPPKGG